MEQKAKNIILDCDPGHDDATAIILAGSEKSINILGICCVSGNQTLEKTARNAFNVTRYLGIDCPIALGADRPLKRTRLNCPEIHGESGLDGFEFPEYALDYDSRKAPEFMRDLLLSSPSVTVVTTGPMTNLALALTRYPEVKPHIEQIVLMGGSTGKGNISEYAEFNILADAEAADICFRSNIPVRMFGLNVTRRLLVLPEIVKRMERLHTKASGLFVALMEFYNASQNKLFGLPAGPLHDPVTIAWLIDPTLFTLKEMEVTIDISDSIRYGETRCNAHPNKANALVAIDVDEERYWSLIEKALASY